MEKINQSEINYWNAEWGRRDDGDDRLWCNDEKAKHLIQLLWKEAQWFLLKKLEVGCGTCLHAKIISNVCKEWAENYTGIDVSSRAVEVAKRWGMNAHVANIHTFETDERFELFLFMDVLEHMRGHVEIAHKVKSLAADRFYIFGNVPLYRSKHEEEGGFERDMNIGVVHRFMREVGIAKFKFKVYGIKGWPYMWFSGENNGAAA